MPAPAAVVVADRSSFFSLSCCVRADFGSTIGASVGPSFVSPETVDCSVPTITSKPSAAVCNLYQYHEPSWKRNEQIGCNTHGRMSAQGTVTGRRSLAEVALSTHLLTAKITSRPSVNEPSGFSESSHRYETPHTTTTRHDSVRSCSGQLRTYVARLGGGARDCG